MKKSQWLLLIALVLLVFTGVVACIPQPGKPTFLSVPSTLQEVAVRYKELKLLTAQPLLMKGNAALCRAPILGVDTYVHGSENQPINVYSSEPGLTAMGQKGERTFPVGSIIVKEKLMPDGNKTEGLGIMIKRSKGFNPEGGDWEYAYWEAGTLYTAKDQVAQCQMCHIAGTVPPDWKKKYAQWGMALTEKARDSVYLTLPGVATP